LIVIRQLNAYCDGDCECHDQVDEPKKSRKFSIFNSNGSRFTLFKVITFVVNSTKHRSHT
jgi:hypothetical protein